MPNFALPPPQASQLDLMAARLGSVETLVQGLGGQVSGRVVGEDDRESFTQGNTVQQLEEVLATLREGKEANA